MSYPLRSLIPYLCSQRLGEDQHISDNSRVGDDELVGLADGSGNTTNSAPGVHNGLTAGHGGTCLQSTILNNNFYKSNTKKNSI